MIKTRDHAAFRPWLAAARGSELGSFARALERDGAAVEAALTLPWSTGPVEGRITQLKLITIIHGDAPGVEGDLASSRPA
jgi:transposase